MATNFTREEAKMMDQQDILRSFRNEFYLKNDGVYMDGNSLACLVNAPKRQLMSY